MEAYMACFRDVFGFYPEGYEVSSAEKHAYEGTVDKTTLPIARVCYPEEWYIPKSRFEKSMDRINEWKTLRYSPYKRISHFREHLNRLQYCQFVTIPSKVSRVVTRTLETSPPNKDSYFTVKKALKMNGYSHFNEHIHHLISKTTQHFVDITYEDRITMCTLFVQLEFAFTRVPNAGLKHHRKNIFSYYLIIQLFLYLFHYHPHYQLPTLLDKGKRRLYYVFLLNLFAQTPLYHQVIVQHFVRKRQCKACVQGYHYLDCDLVDML